MKKALIIHGWESSPEERWYKEEKKLLEKMGYEVFLPEMPGGRWPKKEEWVKIIAALRPGEDTVMIGHSLGVPAILRYLENAHQKVDKVFSIAGFANKKSRTKEINNFLIEPFGWSLIRAKANKFIVINQKDDPYVSLERGKEVADKTGGKFVLVEGNNHFDKMDLNLINKYL